jgi:hypothetical protein
MAIAGARPPMRLGRALEANGRLQLRAWLSPAQECCDQNAQMVRCPNVAARIRDTSRARPFHQADAASLAAPSSRDAPQASTPAVSAQRPSLSRIVLLLGPPLALSRQPRPVVNAERAHLRTLGERLQKIAQLRIAMPRHEPFHSIAPSAARTPSLRRSFAAIPPQTHLERSRGELGDKCVGPSSCGLDWRLGHQDNATRCAA